VIKWANFIKHETSNEKRQGLVWLGINQGTGASIDDFTARLRTMLAGDEEWQIPDPNVRQAAGPAWGAPVLDARVRPMLQHRVRLEVEPFLRTMRRRLARDRNPIHEYHNNLYLMAQPLLAVQAKGRKVAASERCSVSRRSSGNTLPSSASAGHKMIERIAFILARKSRFELHGI
jgi:hypothetical protein